MSVKLYGYTGNARTHACRITAELSEVDIEFIESNPFVKDGLSADFHSKFPLPFIPDLEHGEVLVSESQAVSFYLANLNGDKANLFGKTLEEKAKIYQWASFANTQFLPTLVTWFKPIIIGPYIKKASDEGKVASAKLYAYLDQHLANRTFLANERLTYADIMTGVALQRGADLVVDPVFFNQYPNVLRYFNTVLRQPVIQKIQGREPFIIEKPKEYVPPPKENKAPSTTTTTSAATTTSAPTAPKVEKKEKAPKKKEVAEDEEEDEEPSAAAQEPKLKHPCEALGKSSLNLDDWKRKYSNEETPVAMKWLEENYKPDEFSFWKVTYKYPEELTQVFMSSNLIGGFHNRLEGSRKYLFGSSCVYGTSNNSKIQGVYLCRGPDYKPVFEVGPDFESYEFSPLDLVKDREVIGKNWAWEDEMDGLKVADGKVFK